MSSPLPAALRGQIRTLEDAKRWIEALRVAGMDFHFEDSPETVINGRTGGALFRDDDVPIVRARVAELYSFAWPAPYDCPCGYAIALDETASD